MKTCLRAANVRYLYIILCRLSYISHKYGSESQIIQYSPAFAGCDYLSVNRVQ